jgi:membrane protein involved in colicin uptake
MPRQLQVAELEGDAPKAAEQMVHELPEHVEQFHVTVEAQQPTVPAQQQQQQQQDLVEQQDHRGLQKEEQALLEIPQAAEQSQQAAIASAAGGDSSSQSAAEAAAQQANKAAERPHQEAEEAAALRRQQEEQAAVVAAADAEAERAAEAIRMQRYDEAKAEVQRAESLVGWALDDDDVDAPAGLGLLQGLFAR